MRAALTGIVLLCIGAYAGLVLVATLTQADMIYYPDPVLVGTPDRIGLVYEDVTLTTGDNVRLHGWFVTTAARPRATLLFLHGNAGNISHRLASLDRFARLGLNVLVIDYRGYGRSEGTPDEAGTYLDAEAAWQYLTGTRGLAADEIIVLGRSLGGAIATHLALTHPPAALIIEATFTSLADLGARHYPWLPVRWLLRYRYDTLAKIAAVRCPVLIVYGKDDTIVPEEDSLRLFIEAQDPKEHLVLPGGHENYHSDEPEQYLRGIDGFINRHTPWRR
jgi:fermentation-respiration switch protein FrsA (DUF1100 family)